MDPKEYIQRVLDGDQEAFSAIVETYQSMVFALCLSVLKNRELAEEAAQDTFVKVYRKLGTFEDKSSLKTWIYRIGYHTAIDYTRKRRMQVQELDSQYNLSDSASNMQEELEQDERVRGLKKAIGLLKDEQALIITLYYLEEKNVKEICEILGLTDSNVKIKLFRARKALKKVLESTSNE